MQKAWDFFGSLPKMAQEIAPLDIGFALDVDLGFLAVAGSFQFTLAKDAHMRLALYAKLVFLGFSLEGELVLSTSGGVEYGRIEGDGAVPKLCPFCPTLSGHLVVEKARSGTITVQAALGIGLACFQVS